MLKQTEHIIDELSKWDKSAIEKMENLRQNITFRKKTTKRPTTTPALVTTEQTSTCKNL